jgi:hypothetical protein
MFAFYCCLYRVTVVSIGSQSCMFCKMWWAYADCELLSLMYRMCSLYLSSNLLSVCPMYEQRHVYQIIWYIPLYVYLFLLVMRGFSMLCMELVRNATFRFVSWNKLVIFRIMGLWNVKVVHIFGLLGYSLVMFGFVSLC